MYKALQVEFISKKNAHFVTFYVHSVVTSIISIFLTYINLQKMTEISVEICFTNLKVLSFSLKY